MLLGLLPRKKGPDELDLLPSSCTCVVLIARPCAACAMAMQSC